MYSCKSSLMVRTVATSARRMGHHRLQREGKVVVRCLCSIGSKRARPLRRFRQIVYRAESTTQKGHSREQSIVPHTGSGVACSAQRFLCSAPQAAAAMAAVTEAAADPGLRLYQAADAGDAATVQQLLDDGADVMWADAEGTTALMKAAENGHQTVVAELLEAGAPWNQQDNDGYCAGEYATASKNQDIVELIMEWGVQAELMLMAAERCAVVGSSYVRMLL